MRLSPVPQKDKRKTENKQPLTGFLFFFSFIPVKWCLRKRESMEVRGDERAWKGDST
jgi:hypothetical protein